MKHGPSPLSGLREDLAKKLSTQDALAALVLKFLILLFTRLDTLFEQWRTGSLPPPPPPRLRASTASTSSVRPRAPRRSYARAIRITVLPPPARPRASRAGADTTAQRALLREPFAIRPFAIRPFTPAKFPDIPGADSISGANAPGEGDLFCVQFGEQFSEMLVWRREPE